MNTALFDKQKKKYVEAKARLEKYELSAGVKNEDGTYDIEPLPVIFNELSVGGGSFIRNPLVVQDETERKAAIDIINKTPQAVIDSINT